MDRKKNVFILLSLVLVVIICLIYVTVRREKSMVINIKGFELEYSEDDVKVTIEDINNLEIGDNLEVIQKKIGEPDAWIGSGVLRPVYYLKNKQCITLIFDDQLYHVGLCKVIIYDANGKETILKSK